MHPLRKRLLAVALAVSLILLAGCAPTAPATLTEEAVIGTWSLEAGGTMTFDETSVRIDGLYVSPLAGGGIDSNFSGTGTWELDGESSVAFQLPEWTSDYSSSTPEHLDGSTMKAVEHDGEALFTLYDADAEVTYYLKKE